MPSAEMARLVETQGRMKEMMNVRSGSCQKRRETSLDGHPTWGP